MSEAESSPEGDSIRAQAIDRLKKKRDFTTHVFIYVVVNAVLIGIWALTSPDGFFWPVFVLLGWGIGVAGNAWDVFVRRPITESEIEREERRIRERGGSAG
ncbi:MAG TPA: 2TM domain-containing protein [Solirubrobacterales bacterium]